MMLFYVRVLMRHPPCRDGCGWRHSEPYFFWGWWRADYAQTHGDRPLWARGLFAIPIARWRFAWGFP